MLFYRQKRKRKIKGSKVAALKPCRSMEPKIYIDCSSKRKVSNSRNRKEEMNLPAIKEREVNHVGTCKRNEMTLGIYCDEKTVKPRVVSFL